MSNETDQTKQLTCYISFDPAIDRDAMGDSFHVHFGRVGDSSTLRYGLRDPKLIKLIPGKRASTFTIRPLRVFERAQCDTLPTAEARWLQALSYALVRAELSPPLSTTAEAVWGPKMGTLDEDVLDFLAERVSIETLYEIGAVAYSRSRLGFTAGGYAPLPVTSALALVRQLQYLADSLEVAKSNTATTKGESTSQATTQDPSESPGTVTATESDSLQSEPQP